MTKKSQTEVIEAIRAVSKEIGTNVLSQTQFFEKSDITISEVLRYFPKWSDACHAAGIEHDRSHDPISDNEILTNWGLVTRNLGRVPSLMEYKINGEYSRTVFNRFGQWVDVPSAFIGFFEGNQEWEDVLSICKQVTSTPRIKKVIEPVTNFQSGIAHIHTRLDNRPIYGDPIDFRGLRHEPVNEQGVVFLFGMVARELGYLVEAIQGGFPDCSAKRQIGRRQWQPVQIEFEYYSKNFVDHGHDPNKCDVIVCWIHNWIECPSNIEVVALCEVIKKL